MQGNEDFTQEELNFTKDCLKIFLRDKTLTHLQIQNNFTAILLSRENESAKIGFSNFIDEEEKEETEEE